MNGKRYSGFQTRVKHGTISRSMTSRWPRCGCPTILDGCRSGCRRSCRSAASVSYCATSASRARLRRLIITLNGDRFELAGAVTVSSLLAQLDIDPRRVAVEHNTVVLKRTAFDNTLVSEGDQIEIVNFVGGG